MTLLLPTGGANGQDTLHKAVPLGTVRAETGTQRVPAARVPPDGAPVRPHSPRGYPVGSTLSSRTKVQSAASWASNSWHSASGASQRRAP
jgi:hypothetical protein